MHLHVFQCPSSQDYSLVLLFNCFSISVMFTYSYLQLHVNFTYLHTSIEIYTFTYLYAKVYIFIHKYKHILIYNLYKSIYTLNYILICYISCSIYYTHQRFYTPIVDTFPCCHVYFFASYFKISGMIPWVVLGPSHRAGGNVDLLLLCCLHQGLMLQVTIGQRLVIRGKFQTALRLL